MRVAPAFLGVTVWQVELSLAGKQKVHLFCLFVLVSDTKFNVLLVHKFANPSIVQPLSTLSYESGLVTDSDTDVRLKRRFFYSCWSWYYLFFSAYWTQKCQNPRVHFVMNFLKSGYLVNVVETLFKVSVWYAIVHSVLKMMDRCKPTLLTVKHERHMTSSTSNKASEKIIFKRKSD